ncbi:MAG: hypothetical protein J5902_03670 [Paludibacteraceae bacterium]|nr:hypothetical protein [Paludibacteraceae bacterium]
MATLKILRCKNCMFPLPEGTMTCPKCKTVNKLQQVDVNPLHLPKDVTADYIRHFQAQTAANPKDTNALFGMGLVYMGLKNYELAQKNLEEAVKLSPLEPDIYYYFALSLFEGHNPKHLNPHVADRIEEWLHTASNRQEKRKYLVLLMVLRQCAYVDNGLQVKGESPLELMEKIRKMVPETDDVSEIMEHVQITDKQVKEWLREIQSGERQQESADDRENRYYASRYEYAGPWPINRKNDDTQLSFPDEPEKIGTWLIDEQTRADFFNYMYEPDKPVKLVKPSLPFGTLLKHLILAPVGALIVLLIVAACSFGLVEREVSPVQSVQQEYRDLYGSKKEGNKLRKQHMEELRTDSLTRVEEDSAFLAQHFMISSTYKDEDGETRNMWFHAPTDEERALVSAYNGLEKSWRGLLAILLVLLPIVYGVLRVIIAFGKIGRQRKQIGDENQARQDAYEHALYMFNEGRPSIADYILFCKHYLGKESPLLPFTGDPISLALNDNHIDELDMKGKILFLNYFDDTDDDGNPSEAPHDVLSRIYYVIAIPQVDKLTLLYNYWDTTSNEITSCDAENIYYKNILSVSKKSDGIVIEKVGGTVSTIVFPPHGEPSICAYQNEFPEYITYSNTRTSDPQLFIDALNALVAAHK